MFNQVRLDLVFSATGTSYNIEFSHVASGVIIFSRKRSIKGLIRLHGCAGWSGSLLFACNSQVFMHRGFCWKIESVYFTLLLKLVLIMFLFSYSYLCCVEVNIFDRVVRQGEPSRVFWSSHNVPGFRSIGWFLYSR